MKMVTGEALKQAVNAQTFIRLGKSENAEGVKYDFALSDRILKAKFGHEVKFGDLSESEKADAVVEPGEVVFVLTSEELNLPSHMFAQLSPKRSLSHAGILTLGGFCIDPGYKGPLLVGLYNVSSTPFRIRPGRKLIAATFYELEDSELGEFPPAEPMLNFPDELIDVMAKYQPVATSAIFDTIKTVQADLTNLRTEIRTHEEWYRRFKESMEILGADLREEVKARMGGQDKLSEGVAAVQKNLDFLRGAAYILVAICALAGAILVGWVTGLIGKPISP